MENIFILHTFIIHIYKIGYYADPKNLSIFSSMDFIDLNHCVTLITTQEENKGIWYMVLYLLISMHERYKFSESLLHFRLECNTTIPYSSYYKQMDSSTSRLTIHWQAFSHIVL